MSKKKYCYEYPRPAVTADVVVIANSGDKDSLLLIKRARPPFENSWALPGGFADMDEDIDKTAARELEEETGLTGVEVHQIGAFGKVGRDPRHRTITVAYLSLIDHEAEVAGNDDAAEACWFPLNKLPSLAFDHQEIIEEGLKLRERMVD